MTCQHENFAADVNVGRISDDDDGPINRYSADVKITCADCGERMVFIGLPTGLSPRHPAMSVDATELHAPIRPESAPADFGLDGLGFTIKVIHDAN